MEIPKFHETFIPILNILQEGNPMHHREMSIKVIEKFYSNLTKEQLEKKTKSGDILIMNRIAWGKSYLKKGGFIEFPKRGIVKITEKGKNYVNKKLTLKEVESSNGFLDFYTEENPSKETTPKKIENASPQDLIDEGFLQIENEVQSELLDKLKSIDPFYFEKVILILLKKMGYGDFIETSKTGDGGIDGIINEDKLGLDKIYIQAKRYGENKVREKDIRNFIGAMSGDTQKGVFVTTSSFDNGAKKKAENAHHTIILIDGQKLTDLMYEYNVGIQTRSTYEVKELDIDFFEGE
ncbi:restriction endonuclease [Mangrovimonas yunxiaonensis]|uniref:Restriction endonuclease n=1 Tax=Mangrovimonas yunxiaonensis TaxID=1197477 RepID=A0A084TJ01_9FLAO|nr:restriction endonuclease [Mangrovimonas yunxiaonensis]KFB00687.1 restriction endonuclease [Mangrovimonas yunxiaonensis]MBR9758276.1 restriction endonuclease [Algicola sp.]GGH46345.1 Mrr restriction system protein [Mangrovimonas yunxiaonensis]